MFMPEFKEITPLNITNNTFELIGNTWMVVCAGNKEKCNAMTASWGGLGVMWGKNVAYIVIRPTRYTKEFVDANQRFSLCFLPEIYKKELTYLGTVSGRDEDKIAKAGFDIAFDNITPYFNESFLSMFCTKLYTQAFEPNLFIDKGLDSKWYNEHDYHTLYIAEIDKVVIKE